MRGFLKTWSIVLAARVKLLVFLNALFFVAVFVSAFVSSFVFVPPLLGEGFEVPSYLLSEGLVWMVPFIFVWNLFLSAFLVVTLPGLAFFGLSAILLAYRGAVWGFLLAFASTHLFLAALPTVVLEGEGYVLASVAGTVLGLSWFRPDWVFRGENVSRRQALRKAFGECFYLYVLISVFLLVAAVVETVTLYLV